jgi:hypothetical protein
MKKSTGDSTSVSKVLPAVKGLKKLTDSATSYNKTNVFHKQPVPNHPYGQLHKAVKPAENKAIAKKK